MEIPNYDKTLCPLCEFRDSCNHKKFKIKTKKTSGYNTLKYSYCKDYRLKYLEEDRNEISRRENI